MRLRSCLFVVSCLLLTACESNDNPLPRWMRSSPASSSRLPIPSQYASSNPGDPGVSQVRKAPPTQSEAELRATMTARAHEADAKWKSAMAGTNAEDAADVFDEIAEDYPEYPRAAEARFRQGERLYQIEEWSNAIEALKQYMDLAPVNPHMGKVEELIYRSGVRYIEEDHGLLEPFVTDEIGLEALRYVALAFPAGNYADDALLYLARWYQKDDALDTAALFYKELLLRYPDSEWSFQARRGLAQTYTARDQGAAYNSGFVDRDPREKVQDDKRAEAHAGPVKSSLELAIAQYDKFLERIARDPGRREEYAAQVAQVEADKRAAQEQLAAKDERTAAWYAARGDAAAADVYRRAAARWRGATGTSPVPPVQPPRRTAPVPVVRGPTTPPTVPPTAAVPPPPGTLPGPVTTSRRVVPPIPPPPALPR